MIAIILVRTGVRNGLPCVLGIEKHTDDITRKKQWESEQRKRKRLLNPRMTMIAGRNLAPRTEKQQPTRFNKTKA